MRVTCRAWLGAALLAAPAASAAVAPAPADEVIVSLRATGGIQAEASARHAVDGAHFCSVAPDPWTDRKATDDRATPFPFYRLVFGQGSPEDEPAMPGPSIGLAASNFFPAAREHSDPRNDSIELVLAGRHFIGHVGVEDPDYRFVVTYRPDRRGGSFIATHLHEVGITRTIVDVAGNWQCPPVTATAPEVVVHAHRLFPGATPVHAQAPSVHLRMANVEPHCKGRKCVPWRVIDQTTGDAFMARADFRKLKLAGKLRRAAEGGAIELLVDAEVRPGDPPRVVPSLLAGVQPVRNEATTTADQQAVNAKSILR